MTASLSKAMITPPRHSGRLLLLAGLVIALVVFVYSLTAARIADARLDAQRALLDDVFPASLHDNDLLASAVQLDAANTDYQQVALLGLRTSRTVYFASRQSIPTGVILPLETADGYGGTIVLHIGIDADGEITAVRALQHNETAGLGDGIELAVSNWMHSFDQRSLDNTPDVLWHIKKDGGDFDQFVGATITPRAVVGAVHNALLFFDANRERLLENSP